MLPQKTRHLLYVVLLVFISIFGPKVLAKTHVTKILSSIVSGKADSETQTELPDVTQETSTEASEPFVATPMYATIINGANEEVTCPNDGSTLAKFFLCGTSDIRTLTLSQSGSSYQWQQLDPNSCAPTVVEDCPTINNACTWNTVGTGSTFDLSTAGEFRVRVNSGQYYYFKSTLNPLNPQLIKEDIICGNPGRVEVTNVPAGYEYSLNSASGPYQNDPFFDITASGNYRVYVRLKNVSETACVFPSNQVTVNDLDINVDVTANDILCSGELGSIDVQVSGVPGFYTYRLVKNGVTVDTFGPNGADNYTFANVSPGTYSIRVETNACSETVTTDVDGDPIVIGGGISPLAVSATASDSFGCGATSVDVNVTTSGGTAPYRFSVDGGPFSATYTSTASFSVSTAGTYNILVEDANGCQRTAAADVENIPPPIFNFTEEDANCGGANDGRITVNVTNGYGYEIQYSVNNGATFQISNTFSNLAPGNYNVVLRYEQDSFTCTTAPQTATIGTPSTINATATADSFPTCLNENGGQITISGVTGGTGPYEYSIGAGFSPNPMFPNLGVGTYTPMIRDANGCVQALPNIPFNNLDKPTNIDFSISSLDCITTTASLDLTVTGGSGTYTYEIIAPSASAVNNGSNSTFTGLGLGTYTFRVTDDEGCSYDENYAITDISSIGVQGQQTRVVTCVGGNDGEGRFLVDGFNSTYSYSIDGGPVFTGQSDSIVPLPGLTAGSYAISVTDEETNCTDTATLVIEEPSVAFDISSLSVTDMSCQNGNTGAVRINTVGGWGGNRYTLTQPDGSTRGPKNGSTFSNLIQDGEYIVSVTDANGCSVTDRFTLTRLEAPTLTLDNGASDFCYDNFGAATLVVNATGGLAPYQYRINGGTLGASNSFSGLTPGTYTIEVVDDNDCRDTVTATIEPQVVANATTIQELDCGTLNGAIQVNINNGYTSAGNYDIYEVSINGAPYTSDNNNITGTSFTYNFPASSVLSNTTFQFLITDARGCTTESNIVTVSPPETIAGSVVGTDTQCGDTSSGIVELIPDTTQGVPPYEFSNDNGATFSSQNIFSGYGPGTHGGFVIRDSRGCVSPAYNVTIGTSSPLDATATPTDAICSTGTGAMNGSILAAINNGVAPFDYELVDEFGGTVASSTGTTSTSVNFPNVPVGNYTIITTDSQGCEDRDQVVIDQNQLDLIPLDTNPAVCSDTSFTYRVQATGGTAPYDFRLVGDLTWTDGDGPNEDIFDVTGQVVPGVTYFVEVRDANGCTYIEEIDPIGPSNPVAVTATSLAASCNVAGSGSIDYEVSGVSAPGDFTVTVQNTDTGATVSVNPFTGQTIPYNGTVNGLAPGNYQIIVTDDTTGCSGSTLAFIDISSVSISIENYVEATCNAGALVTLRGFGSMGPYSFAYVPTGDPAPTTFSPETTIEVPGPYPTDYDFYVQDANGCTALTTQTVTQEPGVPTPVIDVVNQCTATSGYQINMVSPISTGSGLPEETYQYNIGSGYQNGTTFTVPNPGNYVITVRDGNGCTNTVTAQVFDFFAITADATSFPTCNAGDGVITVNTTGGSGNFEYQLRDIDNGLANVGPAQINDNVFENVMPGNYNILVTDLDSNTSPLCSDEAIVNVSTVTSPVIAATPKSDLTCYGADNGTITVELQPGTDTDTPINYVLYQGATATIIAGPQGSPVFDNLEPGTYQVEAVSDRGCTDRSGNIIIGEPSELMVNAINTEFSCNPSSNQFSTATITIYIDDNGDGTGTDTGTGPYTYSMNDGTPQFDGTNFQISNEFSVIDNGTDQTIIVTARDQNGCELTDTVYLSAPTDITFSYNVNQITCSATGSGVNPGSIDIIVNEGPGNYEVEILPLGSQPARNSGGSDRVSWDISTPGDYIFAVTDVGSGGCSYLTTTINMPEYNNIEAVIAELEPVTCFDGDDGVISLEVNNYNGVYNYEVFKRDNTGVETSVGVTGTFDTNAPINVPERIENVPAGNLVVRIEALDSPYCDTVSNVTTVRSPDRELTVDLLQTSPVTCNVPGLGEITAAGDGGWGTYEYQLVASDGTILVDYPNTNPVFENLSTDNYTVNIRDLRGCESTRVLNLLPPIDITADIRIVSQLACNNDNDAIIEAYNEAGGQGPGNYLYQLNRITDGTNSGLQTTPQFANLSAGDYRITIFDGWNCSAQTDVITISDPEIVVAELVELQPPGCGDLGRMELTVTNPEPGVDYFYRRAGTTDPFVPFGIGMTSVEIAADITIDPGPFQYDVQNSNGCPFEKSNQISLDPAAPLVIALDLTNATINCAGEATGIIRSEAFGGIGNYQYTLVNSNAMPPTAGSIVRPAQNSGIFRELNPGTYFVYAQSGGCEAISDPIVIEPKDPLVLDYLEAVPVVCAGDMNGQIIIEASGGTGRIRYSISDTLSEFFEGDDPDNPNRKTFSDLAPRTYDIIIQDDLGCTITRTVEITQPMELVAGIVETTPETCMGDGDGTMTLEVTGGTAPYFTSVNSADDTDFVQNDNLFFENLQGGETYVVFVRDANGCQTNVIAEIGVGVDIVAEPIVEYGCEGIFPNSTATVNIEDSSQLSDLLFSLDVDDIMMATEQRTFGDLPAGEHTVFIYHSNGCVTFVEFEVEAYEPLTLEATKTGPDEITAIATGGFGGYEYFFQGESYGEVNTFNTTVDTNITIMVRDQNGCEATLVMPFNFEGMPEMPNFFTPDGDNLNDYWYPKNREYFPFIDVIIYDRYGRVVARLDQVKKWDGNYDGKPLPTGDYWYVVNANDTEKQQFVGHFTLYRE
ncbi:T9SS type B sorting domain-containing protein [Flagellimonas crocea]|uniref:T9SS type B sorting domain-containing protein n=1 Tax=Flagellimonas crocea TaxID=3067311 RepID=UPI00296F3F21|nr:T9SS type B sorting domain-containing protein [Muricauda sp. DH64]